ncbi:DNA polymerase III subunit beta [Candidatus Falkowbacteria bacterium CG10_big_fil_rev_8_21_14_0_10_39_11]|uniref:Beta sliding clamp n=1 Tax=Candidatus Falkowbacteria bacterium CG10_big_fil_rev_8_21_14_0_10_39_11 TaxID=1974565 RepID=A0A2H0V3V5_9BACT|nr:MAG: DNA polymerase III subunit beta [Candidatus Falkowbacteria bacterium CG10_big_fil_rev_8_21_14_0_10_39_11]
MKITCTQENLSHGLSITGHLANKNVNLPILNNVLIEAKDESVKFSTTNLEIGISCIVRGKVETDGVYTVDSKLLADYVGLLPSEAVQIALIKDDYLNVKCKNNNTRIKGIAADDFPVIPEIEKNNPHQIKIADFKQAISQVIFAVANSETRPEISGVFISINGEPGRLTMVGTDSYRLAEKKVATSGNTDKKELIIPVKTLQEVLRILNSLKDGGDTPENIDIYVSDNQILFVVDSIEIISRLVEGQYPDYKQIIPNEAKTKTIINTQELTKVIKTTSLFSKTGIFDINLEFLPENKSVVVSSNNIQLGESVSEIDIKFEGEKNNTTLNFRFLLDVLNAVSSSEISFDVIDSAIPCLIRPEGDDSYLYIIMPIKQ